MPVSDYYEALVFEDGKKFNVSRTVNTGIKQIAFLPSVQALYEHDLCGLSDDRTGADPHHSYSGRKRLRETAEHNNKLTHDISRAMKAAFS